MEEATSYSTSRISLYATCLHALVGRLTPSDSGPAHALPDTVLLDLYQTMFEKKCDLLSYELSNINIFYRILKADHSRLCLLRYFQAVIEKGINLSKLLSSNYLSRCDKLQPTLRENKTELDLLIDLGLRLGGFLSDAGWYGDAEKVLLACKSLCVNSFQTSYYIGLTLECCHRLLHAQSAFRSFEGAANTYAYTVALLESTKEPSHNNGYLNGAKGDSESCNDDKTDQKRLVQGISEKSKTPFYCRNNSSISDEMNNLLLRLYKEFATFYFYKSDYNNTFTCSVKALKLLRPNTPMQIIIDVLRICSKGCVIMRKFAWAEMLIQQAVIRARTYYGKLHPKYAFTLLDYGYYFLNVDCILNCVTVYEEALGILNLIYKCNSLHIAQAHEELSYALYVHEYSSGRFYKAREHIDRAINIMESLLPDGHLMLATTKRVKALILEEIALDTLSTEESKDLLGESELLHKSALKLSLDAFGEMNVQTAKHYGNLGRLYQSMRRYPEAEEMQLRAIKIKENLLGADDYEVGLSLGHLASLYNYHMKMFTDAEKLYYRSISISLKSFGEEYSGLEYDYIGLIHVNNELKRSDRAAFYMQLLHHWKQMRDLSADKKHSEFGQETELLISDLRHEILGSDEVY